MQHDILQYSMEDVPMRKEAKSNLVVIDNVSIANNMQNRSNVVKQKKFKLCSTSLFLVQLAFT